MVGRGMVSIEENRDGAARYVALKQLTWGRRRSTNIEN